MSYMIWGDLPKQKWLAVVADRDLDNEGPTIKVVGFDREDDALTFCETYNSNDYEWAVITGCICHSGSLSS